MPGRTRWMLRISSSRLNSTADATSILVITTESALSRIGDT
jgi:hypothetical protein